MDNLYILKTYGANGSILYKFGYSSNMDKRMEAYKQLNPFIELVGTYYNEGGIEFERLVHSRIQADFGNEWYSVDKLETILDYIHNGVPENVIKVGVSLEDLYNSFLEAEDKEPYELEYPEFFEYQRYITVKEMNSARWNKNKIDNLLIDKKAMSLVHRDVALLLEEPFISSADLKALYKSVMDKYGIKLAAKATLVESNKYLESSVITKKVNGITTKGFNIDKRIYVL